MSNQEKKKPSPSYDDRLSEVAVPGGGGNGSKAATQLAGGASGFVLARIDALEKPTIEEALIEPGGSNPCACNSVCTCVPVDTCACNQVCTCDTVNSCSSYCACIGNCCVGVYYMPCV